MKRLTALLAALAFIGSAWAQESNEKLYKMKWPKFVRALTPDFYHTDEAKRIGDNVLLYQFDTGGWPKNIRMQDSLTAEEQLEVAKRKSTPYSTTIDNGATSTEIYYLAALYQATGDKRYKKSVMRGLDYLFEAQYDNGGFPQVYPNKGGYVTEIEYNDHGNANVLFLMQSVVKDEQFDFLPRRYRKRAQRAFDKGIECILKTQIIQNGVPTVWCAQYDAVTLKPAKARAYELISLSGHESATIINLLMTVENPSEEVKAAIHHGVAWFEANKLEGICLENFINEEGKKDRRIVPCDDCDPLWARFYTIDSNEPFFCDRDGKPVKTMAEIGHERRNGYSWYSDDANTTLRRYKKWCERQAKNKK